MNTEVEGLLREGIERLTAGAQVPDALVARARQRSQHRRRRAALATAATAGTVAAGTIAALVVAAPGAQAPRHQHGQTGAAGPGGPGASAAGGGGHTARVQTVADVIRHADRAISTQNLIMETTFSGKVVGFEIKNGHRSYFQHRMVGWSYHGVDMAKAFDGPYGFGDGQPARMYFQSRPKPGAAPGTLIRTTVDETSKTWYREVEPPEPTPSPVQLNCAKHGFLSRPQAPAGTYLSTSPASFRAALACGGLKITGRGLVDGAPAIKMAATSRLTKYKLIVDVSPKTYLPLRLVFGDVRMDYRWLAPTPANLSTLHLHIPAGFRQVPAPR
jgi:hypothetical protein